MCVCFSDRKCKRRVIIMNQGRKEYTTYYAINPQIVRKKFENKK